MGYQELLQMLQSIMGKKEGPAGENPGVLSTPPDAPPQVPQGGPNSGGAAPPSGGASITPAMSAGPAASNPMLAGGGNAMLAATPPPGIGAVSPAASGVTSQKPVNNLGADPSALQNPQSPATVGQPGANDDFLKQLYLILSGAGRGA